MRTFIILGVHFVGKRDIATRRGMPVGVDRDLNVAVAKLRAHVLNRAVKFIQMNSGVAMP